jgi:hypothetical protein
LREDFPSDSDHYRALAAAYPEISDKAPAEIERWLLDQSLDEIPVMDILLMEIHALHKLLRTTHSEGRRGSLRFCVRSGRASPHGSPISCGIPTCPNQSRAGILYTGPGLSWFRLF